MRLTRPECRGGCLGTLSWFRTLPLPHDWPIYSDDKWPLATTSLPLGCVLLLPFGARSFPLLASPCWCQLLSGASVIQVPAYFWLRWSFGGSLFWYQWNSDCSPFLLAAHSWCPPILGGSFHILPFCRRCEGELSPRTARGCLR